MRVKVKVPHQSLSPTVNGSVETARPDYPLRVSSFFASVLGHCGVVAFLFKISGFVGAPPEKPLYEQFIKPNANRIIFYDLRPKVPDVKPAKKTGHHETPRGAELSKQAIVATSPKPRSTQVFISVPAPDIEIKVDLSVPLLVAKIDTILQPPPEQVKPRKFVPPPASKHESPLPIQTPVLDVPSIPAAPAAPLPLLPSLAFNVLPPPPRDAPESANARSGNANADVAIASIHPSQAADTPVPNGERPAQFSKAPEQGPTASGGANEAALTVPNLTIRQPTPDSAPAMPTQRILYADIVRNIPPSTLSAPLRASGRSIPQAVWTPTSSAATFMPS